MKTQDQNQAAAIQKIVDQEREAIRIATTPGQERQAKNAFEHNVRDGLAQPYRTLTRFEQVHEAYLAMTQWLAANVNDSKSVTGCIYDRFDSIKSRIEFGVYQYGTLRQWFAATDVQDLEDSILDAECYFGSFLYQR